MAEQKQDIICEGNIEVQPPDFFKRWCWVPLTTESLSKFTTTTEHDLPDHMREVLHAEQPNGQMLHDALEWVRGELKSIEENIEDRGLVYFETQQQNKTQFFLYTRPEGGANPHWVEVIPHIEMNE